MNFLMKKRRNYVFVLTVLVSVLCSCSAGSQDFKSKTDMRQEAKSKASVASAAQDGNYYTLPSPLEIAYIIQTTGVEYNLDVLHRTELGVRYSTNKASALNLGIYGADLSYSIYFDQQQVALKYLDCVRSLSTGLDIADLVSQRKIKEIEENIQDKEMLKKIVSQTFFHSDALLKESSRQSTAVMVAAGMWIESLYISAQLSRCNADGNPALTKSILEQGLVLEDLYRMLSSFEGTEDIDYLKEELKPVRDSYSVIRGGGQVGSKEFESLCAAVSDVRADFTQLF
jgi:hypothetical protein